jgi:hypothetical protein
LGSVKSGTLVIRGQVLNGRCSRNEKGDSEIPSSPAYAFYYINRNNREERLGGVLCDVALDGPASGAYGEASLLYLSAGFGLVIRPVLDTVATYERIGTITGSPRHGPNNSKQAGLRQIDAATTSQVIYLI